MSQDPVLALAEAFAAAHEAFQRSSPIKTNRPRQMVMKEPAGRDYIRGALIHLGVPFEENRSELSFRLFPDQQRFGSQTEACEAFIDVTDWAGIPFDCYR